MDLTPSEMHAVASLMTLAVYSNLSRIEGGGRPWGFDGPLDRLEDLIVALHLTGDDQSHRQQQQQQQQRQQQHKQHKQLPGKQQPSTSASPSSSAATAPSDAPPLHVPLVALSPWTLDLLDPGVGLLPQVYRSLSVPPRTWPALLNLPLMHLGDTSSQTAVASCQGQCQRQGQGPLQGQGEGSTPGQADQQEQGQAQQQLSQQQQQQQQRRDELWTRHVRDEAERQKLVAMSVDMLDPEGAEARRQRRDRQQRQGEQQQQQAKEAAEATADEAMDGGCVAAAGEDVGASATEGPVAGARGADAGVGDGTAEEQQAVPSASSPDAAAAASAGAPPALASSLHSRSSSQVSGALSSVPSFGDFMGMSSQSALMRQQQQQLQQQLQQQQQQPLRPPPLETVISDCAEGGAATTTSAASTGHCDGSAAAEGGVGKDLTCALSPGTPSALPAQALEGPGAASPVPFRLPPPPSWGPSTPSRSSRSPAAASPSRPDADSDAAALLAYPDLSRLPSSTPNPRVLLALSSLVQACLSQPLVTIGKDHGEAEDNACTVASSIATGPAARPQVELYDARARTALYTLCDWLQVAHEQVRSLERLHAAQQLLLADRSLRQWQRQQEEERQEQQDKERAEQGAWFNRSSKGAAAKGHASAKAFGNGGGASSSSAGNSTSSSELQKPSQSKAAGPEAGGGESGVARDARASAVAAGPSKAMTALKVGGVALGAGVLLALTGGLAAPAIAAGLGATVAAFGGGAVMGATVATTVGSAAGTAALAGSLGAYGANAARLHMADVVGEVRDFGFVDLEDVAWAQQGGEGASAATTAPAVEEEEEEEEVWGYATPASGVQAQSRASLLPSISSGSVAPLPPLLPLPWQASRAEDGAASVTIAINGWVNTEDDFIKPWANCPNCFGNRFALVWEREMLQGLGGALMRLVRNQVLMQSGQEAIKILALGSLITALTLPLTVITALNIILGDRWAAALSRAKSAGMLLAHQLAALQAVGGRPVTLIGFSMGARLVFHCLLELQRMGRRGIVENVVLMGAPVSIDVDKWRLARSAVSGRFVNAYSDKDWVLGLIYRFRSRNGMVNRVGGMFPVTQVLGVENVGIGRLVGGHAGYVENMSAILEALALDL